MAILQSSGLLSNIPSQNHSADVHSIITIPSRTIKNFTITSISPLATITPFIKPPSQLDFKLPENIFNALLYVVAKAILAIESD
jgi:hypothetical protein